MINIFLLEYDEDGKIITCEDDMEKICKESPDLMIELLLKDSFHYYDLTFAAEIAGRLLPSEKIVPILKDLLYHK
jgi:hypothetical protein